MKRFIAVLFALFSLPVYAQNANQTQLRLVVVDETGAGIPSATIIVTPASGNAVTFTTDERGLAIFERSALEDPLESLHAVYEKTSINSRVEDADDTFHVTLDLNARLRQRIQVIELRRAGETLVEQREDGFTYRRIPDDMAGEDE